MRNPDGSWDGAAAMAELAKIDPAEIRWTHQRLKEIKRLRIPDQEAVRIVKNESRYQPWKRS